MHTHAIGLIWKTNKIEVEILAVNEYCIFSDRDAIGNVQCIFHIMKQFFHKLQLENARSVSVLAVK